MAFNQQLPEWDNQGLDPGQTKKSNGWILGDTLPYQWLNWLFNRIYNCISEIRQTFNQQGYCNDSGTANNYVVTVDTLSTPATSIPTGLNFRFKAANANTGASKITINGYATQINLTKQGSTALSSGDIPAGSIIRCTYDGTNVQIITTNGGNSTTVNNYTASATPNTTNKTDIIGMVNEVLNDVNTTNSNVSNNTANITTVSNNLGTHEADYVRQPGFGITGGTSIAYTLTLNPAPTSYVAGMQIVILPNANSGANPTINVNSLVAIALKKRDGTNYNANDLVANTPYKFTYNGTNFVEDSPKDYMLDYINTNHYAVCSNSGNAYSVTVSPAPAAYVDGMTVKVKFNAASTGAITINVNGLGAKNVADYFGNAVTNVRANLPANLCYDSVSGNFILLGKGGGGNTVASHVLINDTCTVDSGPIIGAMPNNGALNYTPSSSGSQSIPLGFTTGGTIAKGYAVGATINDTNLTISTWQGSQVWQNADMTVGANGISVDSSGNAYVSYYNSSGKSLRKLNSSGIEVWSLSDVIYAKGTGVDSSGNVYVTYANSSTGSVYVRKINSSGTQQWASSDITMAEGIAVDSSGNVYVGYNQNAGTTNVRKFDTNGNQVWALTDVGNCWGVAVDSTGTNVACCYMKSAGTINVRKLTSAGGVSWNLTDLGNTDGVATDSSGNVYVAYSNSAGTTSLRKLNSAGTQIWAMSDLGQGLAIACDNQGNAYACHGGYVRKLNPNGIEIFRDSAVAGPQAISIGPDRNMYVGYNVATGTTRKLAGFNTYTIAS